MTGSKAVEQSVCAGGKTHKTSAVRIEGWNEYKF